MSNSIFKEVTFTPQLFEKTYIFSNHRRFGKLISILESLIESGIIVAVSSSWIEEVDEFINNYEDDIDKNEVRDLLEMLSRRDRVSIPSTYKKLSDELSWINEIDKLNKRRRFDFAAGTVTDKTIKTLEDIDRKSYINSGAKIKKQTLENIKKMIDPILSYAEIVKIYDPYFVIEKDRFFDVLESVCQNLGSVYGKENDAIIDIHTSVKSMLNNKGEFDWRKAEGWIQKIKHLENKYNHNITIKVWENTAKNKWHDRWLVTNQCGVSMGKGSDTSNWTDATWSLLDWDDLPKVEDKFTEGRGFYNYIGNITSDGIVKVSIPKTTLAYLTEDEKKTENTRLNNEAKLAEEERLKKLKNPKKFKRGLVPLSQRGK